MEYPQEFRFRGAPDIVGRTLSVTRTTVHGWKMKNHIPDRYAPKVLALASRFRRMHSKQASPVESIVKPEINTARTVQLSDIAQMIADYLKQKGL